LLRVPPCAAEVKDGAALLGQCTATIGAIVDYCYGYIDAVADYLFQKHAMGDYRACVLVAPDDPQLRVVVVRFLRDHPELRRLSAPELIARALSEKYRCPEGRYPDDPECDQARP
jgi:Rap1a immunity proteins